MKKIFLSALMVAGLLTGAAVLTGCDKARDAVEDIAVPLPFDIPVTAETEVPFATVPTSGYLTYPEITLDLDVNAKIKEQNSSLSINNLKSARLSSMTIELTKPSPLETKLDVIRNARLYIQAPALEKKLAATVTENTSADRITFTPEDTELIDYLKSPKNSLILEVQARKISLDKLYLKISPSFRVKVGL